VLVNSYMTSNRAARLLDRPRKSFKFVFSFDYLLMAPIRSGVTEFIRAGKILLEMKNLSDEGSGNQGYAMATEYTVSGSRR